MEKCAYGYWRLPDDEVFNRYKDLEQFEVESLWGQQLQVPLYKPTGEETE